MKTEKAFKSQGFLTFSFQKKSLKLSDGFSGRLINSSRILPKESPFSTRKAIGLGDMAMPFYYFMGIAHGAWNHYFLII